MKRKVLWIAMVLVLADLALVSNARANRRNAVLADKQVALGNIQPPALRAQQYYPVMVVTVLAPVQLPDQILMPGQYSFRLINNGKNVMIAKVDGEFLGTYLVVPAYRRDASDGLLNTQDSPDGGPDRIASWFFPAQQDGYSFIYSAS